MDVSRRLLGNNADGAAELANLEMTAGQDDPSDQKHAKLVEYDGRNSSLDLTSDAW